MLYRAIPQWTVHLDTFYISRFPITYTQFAAFAESEHRYSYQNAFSEKHQPIVLDNFRQKVNLKGNHPVDVAWHFAVAFCDWIGARLPTSTEWEKAARGTEGWLYPWGNEWDATRGNFFRNRKQWPHTTSPVDAYPTGQSPYGVMDMAGNTFEWTGSTIFGRSAQYANTEMVICRSCECDYQPQVDDPQNPDWFRNLATMITPNEMHFGGANLVGFRPVLDAWHKKVWGGM